MYFFNISDRSEKLVPTQSIIHAHGCLRTLDSWSKSGTAEAVPTTARKTASIVYQWFWLVLCIVSGSYLSHDDDNRDIVIK